MIGHMELVEGIGIALAPIIFRTDGTVICGYRPPQEPQAPLEES